jgi:hypothetical protein
MTHARLRAQTLKDVICDDNARANVKMKVLSLTRACFGMYVDEMVA